MKKKQTKKKRGDQTVHVRPDSSSTVFCPKCKNRYEVDAGTWRTRGHGFKAKCKCGHHFSGFFEFRQSPRRGLSIEGHYRRIKEVFVRSEVRTIAKGFGRMLVKNISQTGIGFVVHSGHKLEIGDKVEVMFTLDDPESTRIERTAVVRRVVKGNYFGCRFTDIGDADKTTGL